MSEIIKNHKKALIIVGGICLVALLIYASYVHWTNYVIQKETIASLEWAVPLSEEYTEDYYEIKYIERRRQKLEEDLKKLNLQLVIVENKKEDSSYDELYGVRNAEGKLIIPAKYEELEVDTEQKYILANVYYPEDKKEENGSDNTIIDIPLYGISVHGRYEYQYYNLDGTDFINGNFEHASMFENGYACVKKNGENYVISENGEEQLEVKCDSLYRFDSDKGLFTFANDVDKVYENGNETHYYRGEVKGIIDIDGQVIVEPKYQSISQITEDKILASYRDNKGQEQYVFWNDNFNPISDKIYERVSLFGEGIITAKYQSNWYIINENEEVIAKIEDCEELHGFSEGIALAENKKELKYIDTKGNVLFTVPNRHQDGIWYVCQRFSEGKVGFIGKNKKYGYMDRQGNVIVEPIFDEVERVYNGEAFVEIGNKAGVIKFQN